MITLKESLLDDIENTMATGDKMINEEKVIITNDIDIGATIAYKDKKEKNKVLIASAILIDSIEIFKIVMICKRGLHNYNSFLYQRLSINLINARFPSSSRL